MLTKSKNLVATKHHTAMFSFVETYFHWAVCSDGKLFKEEIQHLKRVFEKITDYPKLKAKQTIEYV